MTLPQGFVFSQSSLQDYVDCQRRFQLRYLDQLAWPAVEAEPYLDYEHQVDMGLDFHKIVRQHLLGVLESDIEHTFAGDEIMESWWRNYLSSEKDGILKVVFQTGNKLFEEISLSAPVKSFRLLAKADLLVIAPNGKMIIFDWKTSQKHPRRNWLADRLQTHIYPYVLTCSASSLIGEKTTSPDQIEMVYWFANFPEQAEQFTYSQSAFEEDTRYLENLVSAIEQKTDKVYPLTPDERRCLFCTYRSLCNRGVKPGELAHLEDWQEADRSSENVTIDYDQIGEIEF